MTLYIRQMVRGDIPQLVVLDHEAFPTEWPPTNFKREMENRLAYYIVASRVPAPESLITSSVPDSGKPGCLGRLWAFLKTDKNTKPVPGAEATILGYGGIWFLADEAHITSIATSKEQRRQGIGEALLIGLIEMAAAKKASVVTLEARVSNIAAQNLYTKYGFHKQGVRKGYYLDNHEDAVIMTTDYLGETAFQARLENLKKAYIARWGEIHNELISGGSGLTG